MKEQTDKGSFFAGIFGIVVMVCMIITTINGCQIKKILRGESNEQIGEKEIQAVEQVITVPAK